VERKKRALAKGTLLITAVIWGAGFIFSQTALDAGFGAAGLLLGKFGIAAILFGLIYRRAIAANLKPAHLLRGIAVGLILAASFFAQTLGLKYSSPSNCALITAAYVVIVPFLWKIVNRRRVRGIIYLASALCLAGVAVLSVNLSGGLRLGVGDLFTLLAALLFAAQIVATESLLGGMDYRVLLFLQFAAAAVCSLAAFLVTGRDFTPFLNPAGAGSVLFLGVFSTCLCYLLQTSAQRFVPSSTAAILLSMESLFGAVFSVLAGYDALSPRLALGGALVLVSVALPDLARGKKTIQNGVNPL
jgi:drug/metabolite transporter (DMT)-like permease